MRSLLTICVAATGLAIVSSAHAALIQTESDGAAPKAYANGGGSGFGGALGGGSFSFDASGTDLNIAFTAGGGMGGNIVFMLLDTKTGGQSDATMNDNADGGRRAITQQTANADDAYPSGMAHGLPDYGIGFFDGGGVALFELVAGSSMNFIPTTNGPSSISIPLSTLGIGSSPWNVDWFAGFVSDSTFNSNESMPASQALNSGGNPGFDGPSAGYENYNRFVVPEPTTLALLAGVGVMALRRK